MADQKKKPIFTSKKRDQPFGARTPKGYDPYEEEALIKDGVAAKSNCIRVPLIGFNCVLWVLGVVLIFIGGYAFYELKDLKQIANFTVPVGFVVIGVFITVLTIVGCVVGFKGKLKGLIVYTILMFVFFVALFGVGLYAFDSRDKAPELLQTAWAHASDQQRILIENYFLSSTGNGTVPCCGWENLSNGVRTYPSTDCKIAAYNDTNGDTHNSTLKYDRPPCGPLVVSFVQSKLSVAGVAGVAIGVVEFFSVLFSFILIVRISCSNKNRDGRFSYPL